MDTEEEPSASNGREDQQSSPLIEEQKKEPWEPAFEKFRCIRGLSDAAPEPPQEWKERLRRWETSDYYFRSCSPRIFRDPYEDDPSATSADSAVNCGNKAFHGPEHLLFEPQLLYFLKTDTELPRAAAHPDSKAPWMKMTTDKKNRMDRRPDGFHPPQGTPEESGMGLQLHAVPLTVASMPTTSTTMRKRELGEDFRAT